MLEITSLAQVRDIIQAYERLDIPKQDRLMFLAHLTEDRNAWFLEVGDVGLLYFTHVIPGISAILNIVFWDQKLPKERADAVKLAVRRAFEEFNLARVGVQFKWTNRALKRFVKDVGFCYEGTLRRAWVDAEGHHDMLWYGMIKEEL